MLGIDSTESGDQTFRLGPIGNTIPVEILPFLGYTYTLASALSHSIVQRKSILCGSDFLVLLV